MKQMDDMSIQPGSLTLTSQGETFRITAFDASNPAEILDNQHISIFASGASINDVDFNSDLL